MLNQILSVSLSTSIVILLLIFARPMLCRYYKAKLRYFMWLFIAIKLLIPFHIPLPYSIIDIPAIPDTNLSFAAGQEYTPMQYEDDQAGNDRTPTPKTNTTILTINNIAIMIWGGGTVLFFVYHLAVYIIFKRKIKAWSVVTENGKPEIAICRKIASPMMFGILKQTILLPNMEYQQEDLDLIIAHEIVHYKRKDIFYKLILLIANAVHWFNPVVYRMVHYANKDLEFSCDEIVVQNGDMNYKKAYSQAILNAIHIEKASRLSTYFKSGKKDMKERFSNILKSEKKKRGIPLFIVTILMTLLSGSFIACNNTNTTDKFRFLSIEWGSSWDDLQKDTGFIGEVQEIDGIQVVEIKNVEYRGSKGTAVFRFNKPFESTSFRLYMVEFAYEDTDEEKVIAEMEKIYGARKSSYLRYIQENETEIPMDTPIGFKSGGWISEETMETSLTETEKEKYMEMLLDTSQGLMDYLLQRPLVEIFVNEEENIISFQGDGASLIKYLEENN